MIDKRVRSLGEAVAGIPDGATILCAGFGGAGLPEALCEAVIEQGARDLTVVANNAGTGRTGLAALLAAGRVKRIVCSFPRSSGSGRSGAADRMFSSTVRSAASVSCSCA